MDGPDHPQIYLITPRRFSLKEFCETLQNALEAAPVACVRLDLDSDDVGEISAVADALRGILHERDIPLVISEHFRLAERLGLDGVHLGDNSKLIRDLRRDWGADQIIGAFCGTSKHAGMGAGEAGADYIAFGPVEAERDLGTGATVDIALFEWWSQFVELPVVAEGGISLDAARSVARHVDFAAVGTEIWSAGNPGKALKDYAASLLGA